MALSIPQITLPIQEISFDFDTDVRLFIKREDLIHPEISGNKYWKLFFNVNTYLASYPKRPLLITFGGAYSNHISAVAAFGKLVNIPTVGIIRGAELIDKWKDNPTLTKAHKNGMEFDFVTRRAYQDKEQLTRELAQKYPHALIVPEGGTNTQAVEGIQYMLTQETQDFDYLCTAVGTGGTLAGIAKFSLPHQKVLGFTAVADNSLAELVERFSDGKGNVELIEAHDGGYGKITDENIRFINTFYQNNTIPLDPIYTGKMMKHLIQLVEEGHFSPHSKILAFHTGGLQGIEGANRMLIKKNRSLIQIN